MSTDHRAAGRAAAAAVRRARLQAARIKRQDPAILATNPERPITADDYLKLPYGDAGDRWLVQALEYQATIADRLILELRRDLRYRSKIYQELTELIARHERM